jgi:hypothetical protein
MAATLRLITIVDGRSYLVEASFSAADLGEVVTTCRAHSAGRFALKKGLQA